MADREFQRRSFGFKVSKTDPEAGTFKGYASVFGNIDSYGEVVEKGAFLESIKRIKDSGDPLPVLWQHNSAMPIGGSDVLAEDDHGLLTEGWLMVNEIAQAKSAHALMQRRVVKGLSIGYYVEESSTNEKTGIRSLKKLDLVEYSVVTFPANELAQVDAVKSILRSGELPTIRQFEDFLRESGFSKAQAVIVASRGLGQMLKRSDSAGEANGAAVLDMLSGWKITP